TITSTTETYTLSLHDALPIFFADIGKEALAEMAASSSQKRAHAGTALIEQGLASPHLVMLVRGAAKAVRTVQSGNGESVIVLDRSEEHTSELQSRGHLVCRLL